MTKKRRRWPKPRRRPGPSAGLADQRACRRLPAGAKAQFTARGAGQGQRHLLDLSGRFHQRQQGGKRPVLPDNITTWDDYTARQAAREIGEDLSVHLAGSIKPVRARKRRPVGELKESSLAGLLMQDSPGWHATRPPLAGREHPRTDAPRGADGCDPEGRVTAVEMSEMRAGVVSAASMPGEVLSRRRPRRSFPARHAGISGIWPGFRIRRPAAPCAARPSTS